VTVHDALLETCSTCRQNTEAHHRTGTTYKAYPTYDLACPIVDSLEGVSHALRTTEYDDRNEQYRWIQKALNLRCNRIQTFSRVNFSHTVLSKRKLTWFVANGYVTGWDDARFPTVRGVVRRGVDVTALREFMYSQGASKRVVNMVWHKFWAENKKQIDKRAKRFMAIDEKRHKVLRITDGPKEEHNSFVETQVHPKDASIGNRLIRLSDKVILEAEDVEGVEVGESIVLLRWGMFRKLELCCLYNTTVSPHLFFNIRRCQNHDSGRRIRGHSCSGRRFQSSQEEIELAREDIQCNPRYSD
jgi:glutamyl/glutaminyl-tRNA synthetase